MFKFNPDSQAKFLAGIDKWIKDTQEEISYVYQGYVERAFNSLLMETPQWTGNAVTNWRVGIGAVNNTFDDFLLRDEERTFHSDAPQHQIVEIEPKYKKGHPKAIMMAKSINRTAILKIKLENNELPDVYLSNTSKSLSGKSYIQYLEDGGNLRAVNNPGAMVAQTVGRFSNINLSYARVKRMRGSFI